MMKVFPGAFLFFFLSFQLVQAQSEYNDFVPVGPAPIDYKIFDGQLFSELTFTEENNEQVINLLPNELLHKSVIKIDNKGTLSFSPIELSQKGFTYIVKTDYIKYATLPVRKDNNTGEIIGIARVGVGLRIEATITTKKTDVNVADLYQLGLGASEDKLTGNLVLSVMGIESEEVTSAFPVNAEVSPTSVAAALQAQTIVKQAIYDKDTHLTPQILEIKYTQEYIDSGKTVMELAMPILLPNEGESCVVIR